MSSININTLTENQLNQYLESRHSRTSGTLTQKRERLQRFLEFEDQKKRRNNAVKVDTGVRTLFIEKTDSDIEQEMAADALMGLRDERYTWTNNELLHRLEDTEEDNVRLNERLNRLELRIAKMEDNMDLPPPLIPYSNPQWNIESPSTNYTVDTMGEGLLYP
jgi:hypothetical protein